MNYKTDIREAINSEGKWSGELEIETSALSIKWDKVTVMSIKKFDDIIKGYVIVTEEISNYKNVSSMGFKKCQEHYNCIFEQNHLITLLLDPCSGNIVDANLTACNFYGYKEDEFRKKNISDLDLLPKETVLKNLNSIAREDNEAIGETRGQYHRHRLSNGEIRDVEVFSGLVFMAGKKLLYTVVHDISDRKKAENLLIESEERYRLLVEMSPDAIVVYCNGIVVFANEQASLKLGMNHSELIGKSILEFIHPDSLEVAKERVYKAQVKREPLPLMTYKLINPIGDILEIEVVGAPLIYEGKEAVQVILRDVTERRKEIDRAVKIQEHRQGLPFPLENRVDMKTIYKPAKLLSGDFYLFNKVSEDVVIGLLGDVQGKGITAALSISATKVIFNDGVSIYKNPLEVVQYMNREAQKHLDEEYVSCICFEMDFKAGIMTVVGAGINEFISANKKGVWQRTTVKGPPLGMFEEVKFEQVIIPFSKGEIFNFYSDGMEFIFDYNRLNKNSGELVHEKLKACLEEKINTQAKLQDDCTWLSIKVL